jgi:hypothetical protein
VDRDRRAETVRPEAEDRTETVDVETAREDASNENV